jgi:uncharacterized coiled-coil protein SlyX
MIIFEVKETFSNSNDNRLQDSINASAKDKTRKAESLNALKQRFVDKRDKRNARIQLASATPPHWAKTSAGVL